MEFTPAIPEDKLLENEDFLNIKHIKQIFDLLAANIIRSKQTFSLVFVSLHPSSEIYRKNDIEMEKRAFLWMREFLQKQIRKSDMLFSLNMADGWGILLSHSGEEEAQYFMKRIINQLPPFISNDNEELAIYLSASIAEIARSSVRFEDVVESGKASLYQALDMGISQIKVINAYNERENEKIKVSIIDNDEMVSHILQSVLERTTVDYSELEIKAYQDGHEFLQSSWYQSSHTHLVIVNDILPKINGIEVVHTLRKMPNHRKYIILLMSTRKAEEDMIYAYENGVDENVVKPINIKLFESQIKKILKRLRA